MFKGHIIAVGKPSAITPKEALTVHASQALLEMVKTAQVITDSCLLLLFICSIPLFVVLN